jgi:3'-5' exoribonuclease
VRKKSLYAKDIKSGAKVSELFLVSEKTLAYSQKGLPYLNLRLKDKTGELDGKVWENAHEWDKLFRKGEVVQITARALNYKNAVQLSVSDIQKTEEQEVDPADFFPVAQRDPDEMFAEMMAYVERIDNDHLKRLLLAFFADEEILRLFKRAPAAKGFHHVYVGGLLEHTLSVVRLLDVVADHYDNIDRDLLIAGGILHDIGKIYEFSYDSLIDYTDEGRLIGHIVMGVEMLDGKIKAVDGFPSHLAMELRHLILSHHGTLEFGSPKRPKTVEALIVHYIDDMDAKVNSFQKFISDAAHDEESYWTPFNRFFERFIYKGK